MVKEDLLTGAAHGRADGQDFVLGQGARNPLFLGTGALLPVASVQFGHQVATPRYTMPFVKCAMYF
jgi:hypothetical protein